MTSRLHLKCEQCGTTNAVAPARLSAAKCGKCQQTLAHPSHPIDVSDDALAELVASSDMPILVDFWAAWCGPCRAVAPHLKTLAQRNGGKLLVVKVDTEKHKRTAAMLSVQAIPTLAVYKGGKLVKKQPGALMGAQLDAFVKPYVP